MSDGHVKVSATANAPAAELAVQAGTSVAMIWELLPGRPVSRFTTALLGQAHMRLRMTDWAIRHFTPRDVGHRLNLAEQRLM